MILFWFSGHYILFLHLHKICKYHFSNCSGWANKCGLVMPHSLCLTCDILRNILTTLLVTSRICSEYPQLSLSKEEKALLLNQQALENDYHKFVENNLIVHQGLLDKRKVRGEIIHYCLINLYAIENLLPIKQIIFSSFYSWEKFYNLSGKCKVPEVYLN